MLVVQNCVGKEKVKISPLRHRCLDQVSVVRRIRKCFITPPTQTATRAPFSWGGGWERSEVESGTEHTHPSQPPNGDKACWRWADWAARLKNWPHCLDFLYVCTKAHFVLNKIIFKIQFSCCLPGDWTRGRKTSRLSAQACFHSDALLLNNCVTKYCVTNACLFLL